MEFMAGQALADECLRVLGAPATWTAPKGYDGLAEATIDAIWSMGVRYQGVSNVLDRYRSWVRETHAVSSRLRTASQLGADIESVDGPEAFADQVVRNRQRTSTRSGILKAEAVLTATGVYSAHGIDAAADLVAKASDEGLKSDWLAIKGQGSGISWRYLLMNTRVDDIKPDRMICRFVARTLNVPGVSSERAHSEVTSAFTILQRGLPDLTLRGLDHAIWRYESGRL